MKSHRILVVDNAPSILRLVKDKLELAGYSVLTASASQQALDLIARYGLPHLAIVDIMMPGMDGFEFCQTVQQYADLPWIPSRKSSVYLPPRFCHLLCAMKRAPRKL